MCQHWSGAPVVSWVDLPLESVVFNGKGGYPTLYRSCETAQRGFCPICGSGVFALDDGSEWICIAMGTLDDSNSLVPESQSFPEPTPTRLKVEAVDVNS